MSSGLMLSDNFRDGYAQVVLNDKYNFIDHKGNFLFDQWFDDVRSFHDGSARVILNRKRNLINHNGNLS